MARLFRGRAVPADVAELAGGSSRAIAWGRTESGDIVVATIDELLLGAAQEWRVPWDLVEAATWTEPLLNVRYRDAPGAPLRSRQLRLQESGELPPAIRERVTQSVILSRHLPLEGERGAVFAVRKDAAGSTRWTVTFDEGLDPADPAIRAKADAALTDIRGTLGI